MKKYWFIILFFLACGMLNAGNQSARQYAEKDNLKRNSTLQSGDIKVDAVTGAVRYIYKENFLPVSTNPQNAAREYLQAKASALGIDDDLKSIQWLKTNKSPGGTHVIFRQQAAGIPVFQSELVVTINKSNRVSFLSSSYRPQISIKNKIASITQARAIELAREYLKVTGISLGPESARLMIFESSDRGAELSWRVSLPVTEPFGDWDVFVNAEDGRIIHVKNRVMYGSAADGQGMIWDPDPITTANIGYGGNFADNLDSTNLDLDNQRVQVVLKDLTYENGLYKLKGPYAVLKDFENPVDVFPELPDSSAFNFTRNQQAFEAVMVYYHIDASTRRLVELGFEIPEQDSFKVDPHGLYGDDNSHYIPSQNYVAFGEGGIDDAEDADVIWHEHAHSFQTNFGPSDMSYTGETMSLQEGASDYWAASHSRTVNEYNWGMVFNWDSGNGQIWRGRRCDTDLRYPEDYVPEHDGGQIWSSALMKIWWDLGRDVTDALFLQTHFLWGISPGMQDAAQAFIQSDQLLFNGSHLPVILDHFEFHGLINSDDYFPEIVHTPHKDTENEEGPYNITAEINQKLYGLDSTRIRVICGYGGLTDTLVMTPTWNINEFSASIPGLSQSVEIRYYIEAADTAGWISYNPENAPDNFYSFRTGTDLTPPVIVHKALYNQPMITWPAVVSAEVSDNLGVDSVLCAYYVNDSSVGDQFPLLPSGGNLYESPFPLDTMAVNLGDSIFYRIIARDQASAKNESFSPDTGYHSFELVESRGRILVIDDDPVSQKVVSEKGAIVREKDSYGKSANSMNDWLAASGYLVEKADVETTIGIDFSSYDLIISSSGANGDPVANPDYRSKLEGWVQNSTHKLIIEGGEVGYVVHGENTAPDYPDFAANVLHTAEWMNDPTDPLVLSEGFKNHPVVTFPDALPDSISMMYDELNSGWYDQDAMRPASDAYIIYKAWFQNYAGLIIFDDDTDSTSAQIIYMAFNLAAVADEQIAAGLIGNAVDYLLTDGDIPVAINNLPAQIPVSYRLDQNYPNPFNPVTTIRYKIPQKTKVKLEIFDVLGRKIRTLVNQKQNAGQYEIQWNGIDHLGRESASGVYFYRFSAGDFIQIRKMIFLK
ncbi:MAG: T9SS type A sorting domain-containing protein [Calditrichaceae bacterium]